MEFKFKNKKDENVEKEIKILKNLKKKVKKKEK